MRANRYVSFLATEIEPKAFTNLSRFEQATENAFDRIARFNNSGAAKLGINVDQRSIRSLATAQASLNQTRTQAERMSPALRTVARDSNAMATSLERSAQSLTVVQGALGPVAGRLSALGAIFRNLSGVALTGVLGGAGAFAIAGIASDYQRVTDRLRPFYETQQQTNVAMKEVIGIARETRQALDPVAALYSRLGQAAKDANLNIDQSAVTRTVARAARLSGGDAQTQQAGITQFLQGFGSGTLNGDELKSIRENTFRLAKAIADGLGVPIAKLKELGAEGKLTPAIIAEALKRSSDSIDVEFSRLPLRIDQAVQQATNNLSVFIGQLDQATGATSGVAKGIALIGNNIGNTGVALAAFLALYTGRKMAAPIEAITAATQRRAGVLRQQIALDQQAAVAASRIGPQQPGGYSSTTPGGMARAKAASAAADANIAVAAANDERRAREANVVAIEKEAAATAARRAQLRAEAAAIRENAAAKLASAQTRVQAAVGGVGAGRDLAVGAAAATSEANRAAVTAARTRAYLAQQEVDAARAAGVQIRDAERAAQAQRLAQAEAAARQRVALARTEVAEIAAARNAAERRATAAGLPGANGAADPNLSRANRARIVATNARLEAIATGEAAAATQAHTVATQNLAVAENQLAAARRASQTGPGSVGMTEREIAATAALTAAKESLTVAQAQLNAQNAAYPVQGNVSATQRLAAAETQLAVARAEAAAAARAAAAIEAQANVTGFKRLTVIQQQIAAEAAHAAALRGVAAAETATAVATINASYAQRTAATSTGVMAAAQRVLASATTIAGGGLRGLAAAADIASTAKAAATRAASSLQARLGSLGTLMGGPFGIALTAATVGMGLLATQTNEARTAAQRMKDEQDALAEKLGKTTGALLTQTAAARELRLSLAEANLETAKQKRASADEEIARGLNVASRNIDLSSAQGRSDYQYLQDATVNPGNLRLNRLRQIRERNPKAFESDAVSRMFGSDPSQVSVQAVGLVQLEREAIRARKAVEEAKAEAGKPIKPLKPIDLTGGGGVTRETPEELRARASLRASGGSARENAQDEYNATKAKLDAELARRRKVNDFSFDAAYVSQLAAAESKLNAFTDGQRANAAATRASNKAIREQTTALKEAEARGQKLADIMGRYSDEPNAVERGENDKRDIDQFFVRIKNGVRTELKEVKVGDRLLTKADAAELKQRIDDGVRKPITMALDEMEQEAGINSLILQGREAEAEVLREKYRLVKGIANELLPEEEERLRRNLAATKDQNRAIEQRNRLIDVQARVAGNFQNSVRDLIAAPFDPKNIESVARRMISDFQASIADKLSLQLFGGDAEQQARDRMTGALEGSADRLDTSADKLMDAAQAIIDSATQPALPAGGFDLPNSLKPMDLTDITETLRTGIEVKLPKTDQDEGEITVTGRRPPRRPDETNMSIEARTNATAREFANKLFGKNSPISKAAGQLGTFLSGAQYAPVGLAAIQQVTGKKGNELGAIAGGGLGKAFLGQKGGLAEQGLTAISSSLGQFAGPLGSIAGSILGSFAADALGIGTPKTRSGYASIQTDQYGANGSAAAGGKRSEDRIKQAVTYADDVLSSLTNIAEKFGGTLRANTNLGTIGSQNDKFVFDSDGAGPAAGQKFSSIEEAQRAAIKNAIDKGVISGIRAGTQRLLQSGRELETALDRAVSFENVFKELKKRKDPVGAAIDDLNTEFEKLIGIFNEAGASAAEFADLEELYGLRRAEAIKDATNSTIDSLQSFIDGLTASADSPLSRRTAYTNAKTNVDAFRADIAAGKVVDTDKLIEALTNFQDTSAAINGSRSAFYNDFEQIVALAKAAQVNLTSGQSTTLPKSPFDPAVAGDIKSTATGVQQVNQTLQTGLQEIVRAVQDQSINGGDGSTNGASFAFLPSALAR